MIERSYDPPEEYDPIKEAEIKFKKELLRAEYEHDMEREREVDNLKEDKKC